MINIRKYLSRKYGMKFKEPNTKKDIPERKYMVYILTYNDRAIVVGSGKKNRAKIIFDNKEHKTTHVKALLVRLYVLFNNNKKLNRYIINCSNEIEARQIEKFLHHKIDGNTIEIPYKIKKKIFNNISDKSKIYLILNMALLSQYDGLSDLFRWHKENVISHNIWKQISIKLELDSIKRTNRNKNN